MVHEAMKAGMDVKPIANMVNHETNELFFEKYPDTQLKHQIQVRPFNADRTRNMRALNPEDIDQLITIAGMVIRTSPLIPEMCVALFKCSVCSLVTQVEVERGRIAEPTLCTNCNTNHSFTLVHNRSEFSDKQMIKLQESPEDMAASVRGYREEGYRRFQLKVGGNPNTDIERIIAPGSSTRTRGSPPSAAWA